MRRLRILLSAYCCEPGRGSEPGVGWNIALGLAEHHDVWVLTRTANRDNIEAALPSAPRRLRFVYYDLPHWARWWKRGMRGLQLYYYLWQVGAGNLACELHRSVRFDVAHHLTLGKYWAPSFLWRLPVPFIWGPVGGGETAPAAHLRSYSLRGVIYELARSVAQALASVDPFVRLTAARSRIALVATPDTARRIARLGARCSLHLDGQTGVGGEELALKQVDNCGPGQPFRMLTVGRLLHWKGVHLGLAAFARADIPDAEYWIVGEGPERRRLCRLAETLGVRNRVVFWGQLPRERALGLLRSCDVLVHPSLHDFSPTVVLEAMAARKPVLCLALGGPAVQVAPDTGIAVPAARPQEAVAALAENLRLLQADPGLRRSLGEAGRERARTLFTWERKVERLLGIYAAAVEVREVPDGLKPTTHGLTRVSLG